MGAAASAAVEQGPPPGTLVFCDDLELVVHDEQEKAEGVERVLFRKVKAFASEEAKLPFPCAHLMNSK